MGLTIDTLHTQARASKRARLTKQFHNNYSQAKA